MKKEMERVPSQTFFTTKRHHTPDWILRKIADLIDKAKRLEDSSNVLYACLEARNLLEMLSTSKLQCSVPAEEREAITEAVKPHHGIKGVDKELKALGLKTQEFMNVVCSQEGHPFPVFNFNESDKLQKRLSQYIHTYTVSHDEMLFGSTYIKEGFAVIKEAVAFVRHNLFYDAKRNTYGIVNADMTTLPEWSKDLLQEWKTGKIKDVQVLDALIKEASEKYIDSLKDKT
jgi:hypothetical protein